MCKQSESVHVPPAAKALDATNQITVQAYFSYPKAHIGEKGGTDQ